jgi:hypothetical protein
MITAAVVALSSNAAFAFGDIVIAAPEPPKPYRGNGVDHAFPYDFSRLNESPIRGRGAIKVVHNEPVPGDDSAIVKAIQLLQDNGYRIFKR